MVNFWADFKNKNKKIIGLSPMDGLTDYPFRKMVTKYGKPDVIYTEFVCVDNIFHAKKDLISEFIYDESQRPIVAQIFGIDPELFYISAQIFCELGFDGIDINMGCPSKNVAQRGAGAGLIKNPQLAKEIIISTKKGIEDWVANGFCKDFPVRVQQKLEATKTYLQKLGIKSNERKPIPVSVKTRIGYSENEIDKWIPFLIEQNLACIALHGRTYKQMYHDKADWQAIAQAKKIIDKSSIAEKPILLGNGDIESLEQAQEYCEKYNIDGVLIGRAFLGRPWLLTPGLPQLKVTARQPQTEQQQILSQTESPSQSQSKNVLPESENLDEGLALEKIFAIILEHSKLQEDFDGKNFFRVRKHLAWYCKGFRGASELRKDLVLSNNFADVQRILQNFLTKQ